MVDCWMVFTLEQQGSLQEVSLHQNWPAGGSSCCSGRQSLRRRLPHTLLLLLRLQALLLHVVLRLRSWRSG